MTSKTRPSKANALARNQRVSAALAKNFAKSTTIPLAGTTSKVSEMQQMLTDSATLSQAANAAKDAWQTAAAAANAKADEVATMIVGLRLHVLSQYGQVSTVAKDFGFDTNPKVPTAETKANAALKRSAKHAAKKAALAQAMASLDGQPPTSTPAPQPAIAAQKPAS